MGRGRLFLVTALVARLMAVGPGQGAQSESVKRLYFDRGGRPGLAGIRFDVLLERADGGRAEVPVTSEFHSGDRFWLKLDTRGTTFVYVLNRTLRGGDKGLGVLRDDDLRVAPPTADLPRLVYGPQRMSPGKSQLAPKAGALRFDSEAGIEKLYVILSPTPIDLEKQFRPDGQMFIEGEGAKGLRALDQRLLDWSANAEIAPPENTSGKGVEHDPNGYCVGRRPNEPLVVEITLWHTR